MASRKIARSDLTVEVLKQNLHYDPDTGVFRWLVFAGPMRPGDIAGTIRSNDGRRQLCLCGTQYLTGRLAWFYIHGRWPDPEIDHKNNDEADDRLRNLREATSAQNKMNQRINSRSQWGLKGVVFHRQMRLWAAKIGINYKPVLIGYYKTREEAHEAYCAKAKELYGEFANFG